jgi:hypothetical protein
MKGARGSNFFWIKSPESIISIGETASPLFFTALTSGIQVSMNVDKKPEIPLYTKWGIRVSAVIILLILVMVVKNCVGSIRYGLFTEQDMQKQYYELGFGHGVKKAQGQGEELLPPETENLLLRKLYHKGFRDGWDSGQPRNKATDQDASREKDK